MRTPGLAIGTRELVLVLVLVALLCWAASG